jgi:PilZ domain-containing protein
MKEPNRPAERRRSPRIAVQFPVTVSWGKKQYRWHAREFSEFGILLASTHKELVGEDVEVNLALESFDSAISLAGIVAYATDAGVAVRFKDISAEHRMVLRNYIESQHKKI